MVKHPVGANTKDEEVKRAPLQGWKPSKPSKTYYRPELESGIDFGAYLDCRDYLHPANEGSWACEVEDVLPDAASCGENETI